MLLPSRIFPRCFRSSFHRTRSQSVLSIHAPARARPHSFVLDPTTSRGLCVFCVHFLVVCTASSRRHAQQGISGAWTWNDDPAMRPQSIQRELCSGGQVPLACKRIQVTSVIATPMTHLHSQIPPGVCGGGATATCHPRHPRFCRRASCGFMACMVTASTFPILPTMMAACLLPKLC
jgi:hypothetical protein